MGNARVIYWFRTDLRLHDSPALKAALDLDPAVLWPIFTWDPYYVYRARGGLNRWQFLLDCQNDLSASIQKLNPKSKLFVLREDPETVFPKLFRAWGVTHLAFERDTDTSYAAGRDDAIAELAHNAGVEVVTRCGRTLWDSEAIVRANGERPTMSLAQLRNAGAKVGEIPRPIPAPTSLPDPGDMSLEALDPHNNAPPDKAPDVNSKWREGGGEDGISHGTESAYGGGIAGPEGDFAIETLAELGFPAATTPHRGGETVALRMLDEVMAAEDGAYAATFRKPQTSPAAFEPQSTTLLSPFLHFGALSVRLFYHRALEAVEAHKKKKGKNASQPPESLTGQLLFRDMYFAAQCAIGPYFGQTAGNPHCRFIPWHLPSKVDPSTGQVPLEDAYEVDSPEAERWLEAWAHGRTGFPWIDALMRQLRTEGWIHHLGRHSVACFLTRGGCYISWERGAEVFEELLLDHEPACNAGNWQWLSCTAFFSQYFRCYSPISFGKKWDPEGDFVRRWVPELAGVDKKYIYEPWKAPEDALRRAGVRLVDADDDDELKIEKNNGNGKVKKEEGEDENGYDAPPKTYPRPIFDFDERRRICMRAMKKAYTVALKGDDEMVQDGSWRKLFEGDEEETEMTGGAHKDESSDDGEFADDSDGRVKSRRGKRRGSLKREKGQSTLDRHVHAKRPKIKEEHA